VNGQPGFVLTLGATVVNTIAFDIADGRIRAIRIVVNPEKLRMVPLPSADG
jgi:hypothetical protein